MTQPDPNWNPPRGPRNRYPHRRGHVQASSDPNPAPQILQPQSQHTESTRNPQQRNSDPFQYDTQTMPYWDDASGAIHDISNATPRNLDRAYAKGFGGGETETTHGQQQQQQNQVAGLQTHGQHQWHNPYAEIVGGGPYAQDQTIHTPSTPPKNTSRTAAKDNKGNRRDFTPYFDAADPRNHTDLKSPDKYNFLGTKDVNQKIRQDTTDAIKLATEKRGNIKADQPLPPLPGHEPKAPVKRKSAPLPPILPRFNFENPPISPKLAKSRTASFRKSAEAQHSTPLSVIDEAPSPLDASNKRRSVDRTPTLDRVLALRAEEQAKALAKLEGDIQEDGPTDDGEQQHIPRELVKRISDSESQCIPRVTSREEKRQASEFIPGMKTPELDEREGAPVVDDPVVERKEEEEGDDAAGSSMYSSDNNAQEDEIEQLAKAIAGLRPFQDLPPPSPKKKAFERMSAVPVGLNVGKIGKGKGRLEDGAGSKTKPEELGGRTQVEAEAELLQVLNATDEGTGRDSAGVGASQENSSAESFATVSSDDYEQIRAEDELASEQNGVKRRWYKGFRKV